MVATKTQPLEKQKALQLLNTFFEKYQKCCNESRQPTAADFEHMISSDFQNTSNGRLIGRSAQDLVKRIQDVKSKYSHIELSHLRDCLICDNKAVIQYDIHLTLKSGQKFDLATMVIATIDPESHLVTSWTQVSHEKHKDHLNG